LFFLSLVLSLSFFFFAERNVSELRLFQQKAFFSGKKKPMTFGSNDEKYPGPSHIPTRACQKLAHCTELSRLEII
jgi:hypothetical protein